MPIRDRNIDSRSGSRQNYVDATITSAQVLALNATPITVVPAPGAGFANILTGVLAITDGGTAYGGIAATEELGFKYANGSGLNLATIEATGWLDQTTAQVRYTHPHAKTITTDTPDDITPVANAVIVAQMVVGEITTGNYPIKLRIFYRTVPTVSANL